MILAIDQGTTGTTVLLVNEEGEIVDRAYREITQYYPRPGWVEHDPEEILAGVLDLAGQIISRAPSRVRGIGITNQRETVLLWDRKSGRPVHRAIVWQDRRTADLCRALKTDESLFRQRTGLFLDPYFSGTKIVWLLDSDPRIRSAAENGDLLAGTIDTWLVWNLTGGASHVTDVTNASRTLCCNIHTGAWDIDLLAKLNLPRSLFPAIHPSRHAFGECRVKGLPDGLPIAGIAGDQQAALFGQGCVRPGLTKNTYGTGCFLLSFQGAKAAIPVEPVLATAASSPAAEPAYALEGSVFIAGAAVQWLRDELKIIQTSAETEAIAESVPDTSGVVVVPAFVGLGAPHWDPDARGAIFGLTRGAGRAHLVRAVLESIAYQTADLLSIPSLNKNLNELRVDGGACQNNFLMQFQADVLGVPVNRPVNVETTALGAAYLAGLQLGVWRDAGEIERLRRVDRVFEPRISDARREELLSRWRDAVKRVLTHP
ncbi:MAG: glycerol kinase GlpK [Candidatus Sumerlaeota bacterium]|nr:glycerol kinase GlpK [Candidatus Sumerlaeota bacterium]